MRSYTLARVLGDLCEDVGIGGHWCLSRYTASHGFLAVFADQGHSKKAGSREIDPGDVREGVGANRFDAFGLHRVSAQMIPEHNMGLQMIRSMCQVGMAGVAF